MGKFKKLNEEDFFIMNKTFSIWLIKKKSKYFDDLSTNKQRKYFKKFLKKWNKSDLQSIYYDEDKLIEKYGNILKQNSVWKIQNEDTQVSRLYKEYQDALSGVNQIYDFKNDEKDHLKLLKKANRQQGDDEEKEEVRKTRNEVDFDREKHREQKRDQDKFDRKRERRNQEELYDELVPKKVGKEAILEKKKILNQKINGGRDNTGIDDYDDDFLMGGDSFVKAKAREEQYQRKKHEKQSAHSYEIQQKQSEYRNYEDKMLSSALDRQDYMNRFK